MTTKDSNTEASLSITLTDEALSSLPVYVSRVRGFKDQAELGAMFAAVELENESPGL